jgi:hypothetical protein
VFVRGDAGNAGDVLGRLTTDASLGQAIVHSARVPSVVRQSLNVEAGLNDGLAMPFFTLFISVRDAERRPVRPAMRRPSRRSTGYEPYCRLSCIVE